MANESPHATPEPEPREQAMDRLKQQDRILQEARMLPQDRPLSENEIESVRHRVQEVLEAEHHDTSLAQIATQIGYAASTLSQWYGGKYRGNVEAVTRAVNIWIERWARREMSRGRQDYIQTWVCEEMAAVNLDEPEEEAGAEPAVA